MVEPESAALKAYVQAGLALSSCALARVEVSRAVKVHPGSLAAVDSFLDDMYLVGVTDDVVAVAAELASTSLRTLDAIHLAAALSLRAQLAALITYDRQMAAAAAGLGLTVASPGWTGSGT